MTVMIEKELLLILGKIEKETERGTGGDIHKRRGTAILMGIWLKEKLQ